MSVRVIVTGCRHWKPTALVHATLTRLMARYGDDLRIVHGDCPTGIDAAFADACESMEVRQERHPADWNAHGKGAGPKRNEAMVKAGAAFCLAFHRALSSSKGTGGCVRLAIAAGIPVYHYSTEATGPVRLGTPQRATP